MKNIVTGPRDRFNCSANLIFTLLLQQKGIKCALRCSWNWFKKASSRKYKIPLWKGTYLCKEAGCQNKFFLSVEACNKSDSLMLTISYSSDINIHDDFVSNSKRFSGKERDQIELEVFANGTSKMYNKNIIANHRCADPQESISKFFKIDFK